MIPFVAFYVVVGLCAGTLVFYRGSYRVDAELFAFASSVAVFWPLWLTRDVCLAVRNRKGNK